MSDQNANEPNVAKIVTTPSDRSLAADLRRRIEIAVTPLIELMAEANSHGLQVSWSIGRDNMGRLKLVELNIVRPL